MTEMFVVRGERAYPEADITEGYLSDKSNLSQDLNKFSVRITKGIDVEKGTVVFFTSAKAYQIAACVIQLLKAQGKDHLVVFDVVSVNISNSDVQKYMSKGYTFKVEQK